MINLETCNSNNIITDFTLDTSDNLFYISGKNIYKKQTNKSCEKITLKTKKGKEYDFASELKLIYVNKNNYISLLDSNNYLYVFDNNNTYVQHSGGMGSGEHNFKNPKSLTYLNDQYFITDTNNHRIILTNHTGQNTVSTIPFTLDDGNGFGSGDNDFKYPNDISIDKNDNLYISDSGNKRIKKYERTDPNDPRKYSPINKFTGESNSGGQSFKDIKSITVDETEDIWALDSTSNLIQKYTTNFEYESEWNIKDLNLKATKIRTDKKGYIYLSGQKNNETIIYKTKIYGFDKKIAAIKKALDDKRKSDEDDKRKSDEEANKLVDCGNYFGQNGIAKQYELTPTFDIPSTNDIGSLEKTGSTQKWYFITSPNLAKSNVKIEIWPSDKKINNTTISSDLDLKLNLDIEGQVKSTSDLSEVDRIIFNDEEHEDYISKQKLVARYFSNSTGSGKYEVLKDKAIHWNGCHTITVSSHENSGPYKIKISLIKISDEAPVKPSIPIVPIVPPIQNISDDKGPKDIELQVSPNLLEEGNTIEYTITATDDTGISKATITLITISGITKGVFECLDWGEEISSKKWQCKKSISTKNYGAGTLSAYINIRDKSVKQNWSDQFYDQNKNITITSDQIDPVIENNSTVDPEISIGGIINYKIYASDLNDIEKIKVEFNGITNECQSTNCEGAFTAPGIPGTINLTAKVYDKNNREKIKIYPINITSTDIQAPVFSSLTVPSSAITAGNSVSYTIKGTDTTGVKSSVLIYIMADLITY